MTRKLTSVPPERTWKVASGDPTYLARFAAEAKPAYNGVTVRRGDDLTGDLCRGGPGGSSGWLEVGPLFRPVNTLPRRRAGYGRGRKGRRADRNRRACSRGPLEDH